MQIAKKARDGKAALKREEKRLAALLADTSRGERDIIEAKLAKCMDKDTPCKGCSLLKNGLMPYHDTTPRGYTLERRTSKEPVILIISGAPYNSLLWANKEKYKDILIDIKDKNFVSKGITQVYTTSVVQCPSITDGEDIKEPSVKCTSACSNYLAYKISILDPDVIICLGKYPAASFGISGKVKDMYNRIYDVAPMPKFNPETKEFDMNNLTRPAKLIVTYTLAQLVDDFSCRNSVEAAFRQAARLASGGTIQAPDKYFLIESPKEFAEWVLNHMTHPRLRNRVHALDIETNGRDIHARTEFDLEHPPKMRCISFSWGPGMSICIPYEDDPEGYHPILKKFLESDVPFVGHNVQFDVYFMKLVIGITVRNIVGDTMLMAALLNPGKGNYGYGLKPLAAEYTDLGGYETDMKSEEDIKDKNGNLIETKWERVKMDVMAPYNCADTDATLQIYHIFMAKLTANKMLDAHWIMTHAMFPLADMFHNGFMVDQEWVNRTRVIMLNLKEQFEKELADLRPGNMKGVQADWGSPDIINGILTSEFMVDLAEISKTPLVKTLVNADSDSVGDVVLAAIQIPFTQVLRKWRKVAKLLSTYINGYLCKTRTDGKLRAEFSIVGTVTGRLSSSGDANMQNIPSSMHKSSPGYEELHDYKIKKAFIPSKPGRLIVNADQSQLELRIAGSVSGEQKFIDSYVYGIDMHSRNALVSFKLDSKVRREEWVAEAKQQGLQPGSKEFDVYVLKRICQYIKKNFPDERQAAKKVSFGILYGMSKYGLCMQLNKEEIDRENPYAWTYDECDKLIQAFKEGYPTLIKWQNNMKKFATENKYTFTPFGRRRPLPGINPKAKTREEKAEHSKALRQAINTPIQSAGSDFMMTGVANARDNLDPAKCAFVATVHDSVVAEVDEDYVDEFCKITKQCLEHPILNGQEIGLCKVMPFIAEFEVGPNYGSLEGYEF